MKKFCLLILVIVPFICFSQNENDKSKADEPTHYLFDGKVSFSGFGAPIHEFSGVNSKYAYSSGGGGAVLLNQTFFIGGYGISLSNDFNKNFVKNINDSTSVIALYRMNFSQGGFWIGYIYKHKQLVHLSASTKIGWGKVGYYEPSYRMEVDRAEKYPCNFFVITPQIEGELNILRWLKLNIGFGYRYVVGSQLKDENGVEVYGKNYFNSPVATVSVMFGLFGKKQTTENKK